MTPDIILGHLKRLAELLAVDQPVEILLIGGAAGMLTGQFESTRTTADCDVINYVPAESQQAVMHAAKQVATERHLPQSWLNSQAMHLDILPDGWRGRKAHVATFGKLSVYALSRKDLLATKFYAGYVRDREDIQVMKPTPDEQAFVRNYLQMLRVPARNANPDGVQRALIYLDAMEDTGDE
jgi:hypothetical protein